MMPKTNSSLSASWELVFSRPRVFPVFSVSCPVQASRRGRLLTAAAALHFVAVVLLLLLLRTLSSVLAFLCQNCVLYK